MFTPLHIRFFCQMGILGLLLGLCTWAKAVSLQAQPHAITLNPWIEVLEDPSGSLTVEDVRNPQHSKRFQPVASGVDTLNFGFTRSAYWIRLELQRGHLDPGSWLLEVPYTNLNTLDFYHPNGQVINTGSQRSLASRPLFHRHFAFPVRLETSPQYYYLRATSSYALTIPLAIWTPDAFSRHQHQVLALQFLYTGVLISLILYNLMISVALRDLRFLHYSFYAFFLCLGMLAGNGYGRLYLWPDAPGFDEVSQGTLLGFSATFASLMVYTYLRTYQTHPLINLLLKICSVGLTTLSALLAGSVVWGYPVSQIHVFMMFNLLLLAAVIVMGCLQVLGRNDWSIRFFSLAWVALMLGAATASLRALGWLPTNSITAYALQIASTLEMLLLALALAIIVLRERRERETAQQQVVAFQSEKLATLRANQDQLEAAVLDRTNQLHRALTQEKELLAEYKRFGALIAHEFRNPLAIIESQLSVMRKQQEKGINEVEQRAKVMGTATNRLRRLFDKWLQSDQLSHNLLQLHPVSIDLRQFLPSIAENYTLHAFEHSLHWQWSHTDNTVFTDAWALEVAFGNLLENASKYSMPDSTITIEIRNQPGWLGVAVIDQGKGIAAELHEAIFQPFFRAEKNSTKYGMGLGLHLVQRIAQAMQGRIELHSQPGQGSCFCLWLPVAL